MNRKNVQDLQRRHDRLVRRLLEQIEATRTAVRELLAHEADMPDDVLESSCSLLRRSGFSCTFSA